MKSLQTWLIKNQLIILCIVGIVLMPIEATRFWIWFKTHYLTALDNENAQLFSNIFTPIFTMLSAALFGWIAVTQNRVIRSQSIKPNLIKEIKRIKKKFNKKNATYGDLSANDIIAQLDKLFDGNFDPEFQADRDEADQETIHSFKHYSDRNYYKFFRPLGNIFRFGIPHMHLVESLLRDVHNAKLTKEDRRYILRRILNDILDDFMNKMIILSASSNDVRVLYFEDAHPVFEEINKNILGRYFAAFEKHLDMAKSS